MSALAILVAAVGAFAIGSLWYSPWLLGKPWARLAGVDFSRKQSPLRMFVGPFACFLLSAYVLSIFVAAMGAYSGWQGAEAGFWTWAGFVLPLSLMKVFYERRSAKLVAIDLAFFLVAFATMGAILAAW